jgi:sarcosine oxidase subunit delta
MLLIPCPWCGSRPENEFHGGTAASRTRPPADEATDGAWTGYLFTEAGAPGPREERWCHTHGCGQWFLIERDTETGALGKATRIAPAESRPEPDPAPTPSPEGAKP